jgi:mannitol-1-/sugar-/sorbitol-6-phosphatase
MPEAHSHFTARAILFDLDGVLVDSTASVGRVWRVWAERHGIDAENVIRTAHGRRSIETIRACAPWLNAQSENDIVEQMEIDDTLDLAVIPGARELLASLPPDRWAVVTSGTRPLSLSRISAAGLPVPKTLVTANEVAQGKPSPEPYLNGAELLRFSPPDCIVVEDTPPGIKSAHAARMKCIALRTTYSADKLTAADAIIRDLRDLSVTVTAETLNIAVRSEATSGLEPSARTR